MSQDRRLRAEQRKAGASRSADGKASGQRLNLSQNTQKLLALFFIGATIVGLALDVMLAFNYTTNSDSVVAGLFVKEAMGGNFAFVFPANNPYFFTDYIFNFIVQPLSGYSPAALTLTGCGIFFLIVLACALLALRLAGRMEALAAAALVANLHYMALRYTLYPLYHNGTILFILLSMLVYYADRPPVKISARWRVAIIALLQLMGVFSDSIMLPLFTLPLMVYSAYRLWKQWKAKGEEKSAADTEGSPALWLASAVPALAIYLLKPHLSQLWPGGPILAATDAVTEPLTSVLQHPDMLMEYVNALIRNTGGAIFAVAILVVVTLVILERKDRFLQAILVFGAIFMVLGFMSMTMSGDSARYLTFIVILALLVIATGIMRRGVNLIPLIAAVAIILVYIVSNVMIMEQPHDDYNKLYQNFIGYLESKNITHAYSDYWSANVYTYLSGGKVMIEPCYASDGKLQFYTMNSAPRWSEIWPDGNDTQPVIITMAGDSLYEWAQEVNKEHPPEITYELGNGYIYIYNGTLPS